MCNYVFFSGYNQRLRPESNFLCFVFLTMLHIEILTPSIFLSVNFGLPGENVITSTIGCTIKGRKMKEVCIEVGHKKLRNNFRG